MEAELDDLECLDLGELVSESQINAMNEDQLKMTKSFMKTLSRKNDNSKMIESLYESNIQPNVEESLANTMKKDIEKFIQKNEEANLVNNFTINFDKTFKKETQNENNKKDTFLETLKKTKIKKNDNENNNENDSLFSTLKINNELLKNTLLTVSNTDSVISNSFTEGLQIGSYTFDGSVKISKLLGEGAQAKVYLGVAEDEEDSEAEQLIMAIKHFVFLCENKDNTEIDNLVNKCQNMKELSHDNIIQYFDCESEIKEDEKRILVNIAMEYQETNLSEYMENYLKNNKLEFLPIKVIAKITKKILQGLSYLHENKIIHRDLKPENILMSKDGENVKIGDFGISTYEGESDNRKNQLLKNRNLVFLKRSVAGTAIYMAPEVLLSKPYGYDCDIWSLGCIVFEMTGGVKPYCTKEKGKSIPTTELQLLKYSNPLEMADENVKDIIYDKKNRLLLDFLLKCWRGNNVYRPTANELLQHPFLLKGD